MNDKQTVFCTRCRTPMNVPVGIGKIKVTCVNPNCRNQFIYDTNLRGQNAYEPTPPPNQQQSYGGFRSAPPRGNNGSFHRPKPPRAKMPKARLIGIIALIIVLVAGVTGVIIAATGGGSSSSVGKRALRITDQYIDGEISASDALNLLTECENDIPDTGNMKDTLLKTEIGNIKTAIFMAEQTSGMDYSGGTLLVRRNELARDIGEPER